MKAQLSLKRGESVRVDAQVIRDLRKLVSQGEGDHLEFKAKANHPDKIARSLCAFANGSGGRLLLGVLDNKEISGVRYPDEEAQSVTRLLRTCRPSIKCKVSFIPLSEKRTVVLFEVRPSNRKPVLLKLDKGQAYYRVGDQCIQAGPVMTEVMKRRSSAQGELITFGDEEKEICRILSAGQPYGINEIRTLAGKSLPNLQRILVKLVSSGVVRILPGASQEKFRMNMY
jgi:hypothetical protein